MSKDKDKDATADPVVDADESKGLPPLVSSSPGPDPVDHHTASQQKPKNWEPLSTTVPAISASFVNTDYTSENKMWKVVVGFIDENDAKRFHDAFVSGHVMLMHVEAAHLLAVQLAKPVAPVV